MSEEREASERHRRDLREDIVRLGREIARLCRNRIEVLEHIEVAAHRTAKHARDSLAVIGGEAGSVRRRHS